MIKSMTGYGKGVVDCGDSVISVEVRSLNHRFCDVSIKAPRSFLFLESEIKKRVGEGLRRGKIDVFINQEIAGGTDFTPDWNSVLAQKYQQIFQEMKAKLNLSGEVSLSLLASQKDVIAVGRAEICQEDLAQQINKALDDAIGAAQIMRAKEGQATRVDIENRLAFLFESIAAVEKRAEVVPLEWKEKFSDRLRHLQKEVLPDPQRIAQEVAIFADRCDISEEVVRFKSHLSQFEQLFDKDDPVGRQMDFLVQELFREANTVGSKANDFELSSKVVSIKAELEKIREQVQNIA